MQKSTTQNRYPSEKSKALSQYCDSKKGVHTVDTLREKIAYPQNAAFLKTGSKADQQAYDCGTTISVFAIFLRKKSAALSLVGAYPQTPLS